MFWKSLPKHPPLKDVSVDQQVRVGHRDIARLFSKSLIGPLRPRGIEAALSISQSDHPTSGARSPSLSPGLCTFRRADPWATCAAAFCVFLRNPCKLLKTLGWLCIEFYALVPLFQRSVSIDRSMHDFYWVFA